MTDAEREITKLRIARLKRMFVNEYLVDFDPRRAALACGLPAKSGPHMLSRKDVDTAVNKRIAERRRQLDFDGEMVLREIANVAFSSVGDYFNPDWTMKDAVELTDAQKRAIESVQIEERTEQDGVTTRKVRFKLYNKLQASELLGKNLKLFQEARSPLESLVDGLADRLAEARARVALIAPEQKQLETRQ